MKDLYKGVFRGRHVVITGRCGLLDGWAYACNEILVSMRSGGSEGIGLALASELCVAGAHLTLMARWACLSLIIRQ